MPTEPDLANYANSSHVACRIGGATDRLVTTDSIRRVLLIGLIVVALLLFAQGMGVQVAHLLGR